MTADVAALQAIDLDREWTHVVAAVETILAARVAVARAEGYEAGRAEVTAAVEALARTFVECSRTAEELNYLGMGKGQAMAFAGAAERLRALAAAPTLATVRADAARDALLALGDRRLEWEIVDARAEAVGDE